MSLLIIGGAFVVALLALTGLVFVIRSEASPNVAQAVAPARAEPVATPAAQEMTQQPIVTQKLAPATQKLQHLEEEIPALQEEEALPVSNGQFQELSVQLATLHEQAQEFEHRLSVLTDMIRHIERTQNNHLSLDDAAEAYASTKY